MTFNYKLGDNLIIQRKDILNSDNEVVYDGATGNIILGKLLSDEGGEGKVYSLNTLESSELDRDLSSFFVAKIYLDEETANSKKSKILAMLDMLSGFRNDESLDNVCWPFYAIYDKSKFVGFIMPKATGKTLANLFYPDILSTFPQYTRKDLIKICQNIIRKIDQLHAHNIIIGDINEDNFIIKSPDEVYFIDTDSYQLKNYPCKVERLEYKAPELIENDDGKLTMKTEGYSTSVLIFKILMLGKHPFTCKNVDEYTTEERILQGLFPYSMNELTTKQLAPNGFYSYIWKDFTKELKMFFINIFTRADGIESVNDISKFLAGYDKFICDNNKLDLVPTEFNTVLEKAKKDKIEEKKRIDELKNKELKKTQIISNNDSKSKEKIANEILNAIGDKFHINGCIRWTYILKLFDSDEYLKHHIIAREKNDDCYILCSDLGIRVNYSIETHAGHNRRKAVKEFYNEVIKISKGLVKEKINANEPKLNSQQVSSNTSKKDYAKRVMQEYNKFLNKYKEKTCWDFFFETFLKQKNTLLPAIKYTHKRHNCIIECPYLSITVKETKGGRKETREVAAKKFIAEVKQLIK